MMRYFLYFLSLAIIFGCGNNSQTPQNEVNKSEKSASDSGETKCKYGSPVAIFSAEMETIKDQQFESSGQKGVETVVFTNGKQLELYQSGCNEIRQEYRFTIKGNYKEKQDSFWLEQAIENLSFVGQLDERYAVIGMWVGALERISKQIVIGQFSEVEPGTFIMVDKLVEQESSLVIVVLERRV